jgi:conjugal transfer ATP-binding protein TraC
LKESKRVVLSEGMYELLKSVHTDSGNYSEIFVYAPTGIAIGRLSVDRFTQLLYSTKAEEYARVRELVAQGKTVIEAIREIIEREKRTGK